MVGERLDLKAAAESLGYTVVSVGEGVVWVRSGPGKQRLLREAELVAQGLELLHRDRVSAGETIHFSDRGNRHEFGNGRSRWITHGKDQGTPEMIRDFADPVGRAHWPRYVVKPDGREGPAPFESASEQRDYEQLTGQRAVEPDERRAKTLQTMHQDRLLDGKPNLGWVRNYKPDTSRTKVLTYDESERL